MKLHPEFDHHKNDLRTGSNHHNIAQCYKVPNHFATRGQHSRSHNLPNRYRFRLRWQRSSVPVSFGSFLSYRVTDPPKGSGVPVLELDLLLRGLLIRCNRFQDSQEVVTIASTIEQGRCNFKSHD